MSEINGIFRIYTAHVFIQLHCLSHFEQCIRGIRDGFNGLLCFDKVFVFLETGDNSKKAKAIRIFGKHTDVYLPFAAYQVY